MMWFWLKYFPNNYWNIFIQFIQLCCVTNVFVAAKFFCYNILFFLQTFNLIPSNKFVLYSIFQNQNIRSFYWFKCLTTESFFDLVEIYSIMHSILRYIPLIYIVSLTYFYLLILTHLFSKHSFSTPWKHQKTLRLGALEPYERVHWKRMG